MIFPTLIILVLLFIVISLSNKNKNLKNDLQTVIVNVQSTENITTETDHQDRSFVTKLKNITIHTDMEDSSCFTINQNKE